MPQNRLFEIDWVAAPAAVRQAQQPVLRQTLLRVHQRAARAKWPIIQVVRAWVVRPNELDQNRSRQLDHRAPVAPMNRVGDLVGLTRMEEEHLVGVGNVDPIGPVAHERPGPREHDLVTGGPLVVAPPRDRPEASHVLNGQDFGLEQSAYGDIVDAGPSWSSASLRLVPASRAGASQSTRFYHWQSFQSTQPVNRQNTLQHRTDAREATP